MRKILALLLTLLLPSVLFAQTTTPLPAHPLAFTHVTKLKAIFTTALSAPPTSTMLRVCSRYKKIFVNGVWIEVGETRLFDGPEIPSLTHGICGDCNAKLRTTIDDVQNVPSPDDTSKR